MEKGGYYRIHVDGYKWFGKRRISQISQRGEGEVGSLVCEYLVSEVEFYAISIHRQIPTL